LKNPEQVRKGGQCGTSARDKSYKGVQKKQPKSGAESAASKEKTKAQVMFQGQHHHKKQRKMIVLDQWIEVEVENGQTITRLYPSNEKLIEKGKAMLPAPDLVYRRLNFPASIPPEYYWATQNPEARERGGTGIQRMTVDTWFRVIEREKAQATGHIGPTGVGNLPRPTESGVCECEVCSRSSAILERD
jgi:hypothetical protein